MIKNFETVKKQLRELAGVVNSFKSEAVQLRIVELIFGIMPEEEVQDDDNSKEIKSKPKSAKRKKKASSKLNNNTSSSKPRKKPVTAGTGSIAVLTNLFNDGFFSKPKTISDIIKHCDTHLARKFKANEFSGKLARMTRDGELTRKKNKDNQYEYSKA